MPTDQHGNSHERQHRRTARPPGSIRQTLDTINKIQTRTAIKEGTLREQ